MQLWFDVESKYEATSGSCTSVLGSCGLMQNQNMKQLKQSRSTFKVSCGLMQNQNMKRVELKLKETTAPVAWWVPLKK